MKLSIGRFAALILALAAVWAAYTFWWSGIDQNKLIRGFNGQIQDNGDKEISVAKEPASGSAPAEEQEKAPW